MTPLPGVCPVLHARHCASFVQIKAGRFAGLKRFHAQISVSIAQKGFKCSYHCARVCGWGEDVLVFWARQLGGGGVHSVWQCQMEVCPLSACTRTPRAGRKSEEQHSAWPERCVRRLADRRAPEAFHFFLRVARDSRTPTRTGSTRACQSESARGFRESYRILRPAKLPLTTDAHARRHADAPQTELSGRGRRGVLRVLVSCQFWKFSSIPFFF